MRVLNFLLGFLLGSIIGASTVLLTTPKSGGAFKDDVRARFDKALDEGRQAAEVRRTELEARLATLRG